MAHFMVRARYGVPPPSHRRRSFGLSIALFLVALTWALQPGLGWGQTEPQRARGDSVNAAPRGVNAALIAGDTLPPLLSDFGFFSGGNSNAETPGSVGAADSGAGRPARALIPYTLRSPLFSDFAEKRRFIFLPTGTHMLAHGSGLVEFPLGTAIIKSFGYPAANGRLRLIETRLLLHRASGWVALPYIWRADGSDADLRLAGGRQLVSFTGPDGQARQVNYAVPNRNQCKNCHESGGVVTPIGPRVMNMELAPRQRNLVQGADWVAARMPRWDDPASGSLNDRARAYLDVNCAHCHTPRGSASNSGLFLEYWRPASMETGLFKRPVAAGRGSGGFEFDITPGAPDASILLHRLRSTDPGVAMPELGRSSVHDAGVALIRAWIAAMPEQDNPASTGSSTASIVAQTNISATD